MPTSGIVQRGVSARRPPQPVSWWFRARMRAASLPAIRPHDLRHSYATAGLAADVPEGGERAPWHATVAFTLDTYTALDRSTADVVAGPILGIDVSKR
jgi:integrase